MDNSEIILQLLKDLKVDMDRRFDETKTDMDRRFDEVKSELGAKIDATNQRIDNTNQRIDNVKSELGGKIDATNKRIDDTNHRIDDTNKRIDDIKDDLRVDSRKLEQVYECRDKVKVTFGWQWSAASFFIAVIAVGIVKILNTLAN